jgi:glutaredoxin-like protein
MSFLKTYKHIIQNAMSKLKNPVSLILITDLEKLDDGSEIRHCMSCESVFTLLSELAEKSDGKLKIEEYSINKDKDIITKYKIKRIPTILILSEEGNELIRYIASPLGSETSPFLQTIQFLSGSDTYFKDLIVENLPKIQPTEIKIFITLSCPYCPQVVASVNKFAIASKGKIKASIIDIDVNPDLAELYGVYGVPHTVINEKQTISGMISLQDLIEILTKGKSTDSSGMFV